MQPPVRPSRVRQVLSDELAEVQNGMMLVPHDDGKREYAYGPAKGLPATKVGTFTQPLYDEAKSKGWAIISMKTDWKVIFPSGGK